MKKRIILLTLIAVSFVFISFIDNHPKVLAKESTVLAKCATPEFGQSYKTSKVIFAGKVLNMTTKGDKKVIEFNVEKYWKGMKTKKIEISVYETMRYQANYEIGKKYLVYAQSNEDGTLIDVRCSRSREISDPFIATDLKKLGKGKK